MSLSQAWAQPPFGYAQLSNCYQQFNWGVAQPDTPYLNFINSPGGRFLSFNVGGNPHDIDGYQVVYFDQNGDSVMVSNTEKFAFYGHLTPHTLLQLMHCQVEQIHSIFQKILK